MKKMKNNNYPNWLVPLEIARKLKEIGMTGSEFVVCNDEHYGWYRNEEMYDYDNDGEFIIYTALEASEWKNSNLEPTYTWEQVFEWFREKKIYGNVNQEWEYGRYNSPIGLNYFYVINDCRKKKINKTKAIAREALVKALIQTYKSEQL